MLKFITGNKDKFEEVRQMLGLPLEQLGIDLPEPQSLDAQEIIREKLLAAEAHAKGEYIVEDTSLYFECFDYKLPGPFIKWFLKVQKPQGLYEVVQKMGSDKCTARTIFGYANEDGQMHFFEGVQEGMIVAPRGDKDFGWGPIFQPSGETRTFGEMEREEKFKSSMRAVALTKLKEFLNK